MDRDWLLLGDVIDRAARLWGDRCALIFGDRSYSYNELSKKVDEVAKGLISLGVKKGDHVAVWMTNRPEWLYLMYAVPKIGACLVPLNTRYRTDDVSYTVIQSESQYLIAADQSGPINYGAMIEEASETIFGAGHLRKIVMLGVTIDGATAWDELLGGGNSVSDQMLSERASAVLVTDRMMLAYTSGTTGHPKGVIHCHKPVKNTYERAMLLGHTMNDIHLSYLPLFHAYGFSEVALMASLSGGCQILFETFEPSEILDAVEREKGTVLHGFDTHWADLLRAQSDKERDVSSLRVGTLPAGMKSSVPVAQAAQEVFCSTTSGFGMSESWAFVASSHVSDSLEQRIEASGYPMYGIEFQIRDLDTGESVDSDLEGGLFVRGYTVTEGYWRKPEATAEVLSPDGWLDTGDIAKIRADGHIVFVGRHKDMLKVGGENVSPAEVEGYLLGLEGVEEVAVVSYPDDRLVQVPVAFVVRSNDIAGDAVINACRGRIASFKIPRHIIFVEAMPTTPSGKIRKVELREWALEMVVQ